MGYTATSIYAERITIKAENIARFDELLTEVEVDSRCGGHISWCAPLSDVRERNGGDSLKVVAQILSDYGFAHVDTSDEGDVHIQGWGGDKLGFSWDPMWNALGEVAEYRATWVMVGEDGYVWGEAIVPSRGRLTFGMDDVFANLDPVALYES